LLLLLLFVVLPNAGGAFVCPEPKLNTPKVAVGLVTAGGCSGLAGVAAVVVGLRLNENPPEGLLEAAVVVAAGAGLLKPPPNVGAAEVVEAPKTKEAEEVFSGAAAAGVLEAPKENVAEDDAGGWLAAVLVTLVKLNVGAEDMVVVAVCGFAL
jgi:hypothetical protein